MAQTLRRVCVLVVTAAAAARFSALAASYDQTQPAQGRGDTIQGGRGNGGGRGGAAGRGTLQRPPRDQNRTAEAVGTAAIAGRVFAADTGRPIKRARVIVSGNGRPRSASTDEQGRYRIVALPAGTYSISAAKTGFVDAFYGQRRALHSGTPVQLGEGQQISGADIRLPKGGVITGHVFDEDGEPLARAPVSVQRYLYVGGEKRLGSAGGDESDDRGQYRIFGLPPGEYFVSATAGGLDRVIGRFVNTGVPGEEGTDSTGYAPTYYPGVTTVSDAMRLKLATAQELTGIDFQLQLVPLATVHGTVAGGASMTIMLLPAEAGIDARVGRNFRGPVMEDGTFSIPGVPPGRYTAIARGDGLTAMQSLTVSGSDVTVSLTAGPGANLTGTITLEAGGADLPRGFSGFKVAPLPLDLPPGFGRPARAADVADSGAFSIRGLTAGRYIVRGNAPQGWMIKAVYINGRDVTDQPLEIGNDNVSGVNVIFTDRISTVSGTVRDSRGAPVPGTTVIVFAPDSRFWTPQSRLVRMARTDPSGAYQVTPLPAGDYLIVATDDVEQGEWFDPEFLNQIKDSAVKVTVAEGEQRTQDIKAS